MPKELKEALRERLEARARELGDEGFVDKIADETVATTIEELHGLPRAGWAPGPGHAVADVARAGADPGADRARGHRRRETCR